MDEHSQWRWDLLDQILPCELLLRIAAVKPPLRVSYDAPGWEVGTSNEFTVRSAGVVSRGVFYGPFERIWRVIAEFKGLPRVQLFLWLGESGPFPEILSYDYMVLESVDPFRCLE
ncbi:hypothetical protein V6N12_060294 [Hibiscus sabdariffa]|uniref:Uncharacterized protein n=1 Tax=Hibiscus sabdariffa TaxID=183260 RepID=A0ABR2D419_9ROSI